MTGHREQVTGKNLKTKAKPKATPRYHERNIHRGDAETRSQNQELATDFRRCAQIWEIENRIVGSSGHHHPSTRKTRSARAGGPGHRVNGKAKANVAANMPRGHANSRVRNEKRQHTSASHEQSLRLEQELWRSLVLRSSFPEAAPILFRGAARGSGYGCPFGVSCRQRIAAPSAGCDPEISFQPFCGQANYAAGFARWAG